MRVGAGCRGSGSGSGARLGYAVRGLGAHLALVAPRAEVVLRLVDHLGHHRLEALGVHGVHEQLDLVRVRVRVRARARARVRVRVRVSRSRPRAGGWP